MANNKKFIVKNGLLTQENVVIGSATDNGVNKLQVTGSTKLSGFAEVTQPTAGIASLNITNSGGYNANSIIAQFTGDADSLRVINFDNGAYTITNAGQDNGIRFYNNTDGLDIVYNNSVDIEFNAAGIDFKREPSYNGSVFWNAGNDGANSGLDADLLDGLDSLQFLRSDQDDTMNGSLTITGDLTVQGSTTTVNTETILLADNIITLNSNYTGSTPTENAGIEVERGTLDNATFIWNETSDKWVLAGPSQGLILGDSTSLVGDIQSYANSFIIQAGGASGVSNGTALLSGKRGGTEADAGVASFWNTSGVSYGELRYNGSAKLRTENTGVVTAGNHRIQGTATVGTGSGGAYIYMDGAGTNGTIYSSAGEIGFLNSTLNYALKVDSSGDVRVTDDLYAPRLIDADDTDYLLDPAGGSVLNNITLNGSIIHKDDTDTYITFPAADQFEVRTGGSQRLLVTNTYTQSSVDLRAPKFVDSDNNAYYADPASSSVFNTLGIDSDLFHNGDTDTKISFATDTITLAAGGSVKLTANTTGVFAPIWYDQDDVNYFVDPNSLSELNSANFYSGAANNSVNIGISAAERFNIDVTDGQGYIRYIQDETDNTDHSVNFEIISGGNGTNRFNFNAQINAGGNAVVGGVGIFSSAYAGIYYDLDDENYYADFNNTDVSIKFAGEAIGGNGSLTTPTYSFVNDPNTGMYRYGADILGFSAGGNDEFRIYTTYTLSPGSSRAPIFYDSNNTAYYGDFASTSVMNNIGIDSDLFHNGDTDTKLSFGTDTINLNTANVTRLALTTTAATFANNTYAPRFYTNDYLVHNGDENTYIGFNANDTFGVWTAGANRLTVNATAITGSVDFVGPRFVDSDNNAYYANPSSSSVFNTLGLDSDLFHNGDTDTKLAFSTDSIALNTAGSTRLTANNTGVYVADLYASSTVNASVSANAPIFYDSDDNNYYADFANSGTSIVTAGKIGAGTTSPAAMVDINIPTAMGPNPYAAGNQYVKLGDAGTVDFSIAGDNLRDVYFINNADGTLNFADSGANIRFAVDAGTGDVVVGDAAPTYTDGGDNTPVVGSISNAKLHVNGSIYLNGANDGIIFGRGTASFLKDEELAFGWGGGFYMDEGTTVKIRNDKALSTGGNITAANMYAARFYDSGDNNYYADPAGDSQFNTLDIDDYIRHRGDTNTYMGFDSADGMTFVTGGTERFNLDNDSADFSVNVYAPRYYDSDNNAYYADPAGTSQFNRIDIDDYIRHRGDTNNYFGFAANDTFRVWTGGTQRLNIDTDSADFAVNVYAPRYYDSNDSTYYADPAGFSVLGGANFGVPGNGSNTKGRYITIEGNTDASGEASSRIFFAEHNSTTASMSNYGMSFGYRGGATSIIGGDGNTWTGLSAIANGEWGLWGHDNSAAGALAMFGPRSGSYVTATGSFRAPIFYDSNNTAYYANPASTSVFNTMRANRYQVRGSTYFIDEASGDYGSIRVEGQKSGWAGYAIYDDWVFMSNGASNAGIYNDTRNEWAMQAADNSWTRLYANGVHQISAENGYGYAPTSMRSPIFYDSDDTNWYGNFAGQSRFRDVAIGDQGILASGYPLTVYDSQRYLIGMRYSAADGNYPWLFHDNKDGISAWGIHFNGIGDRFWVKEDGDAYLEGEMEADNFLIGTGNEPIPILKSYGAGTSELKLFDGNLYWEKRATKALQGSESNGNQTAEYSKSSDAPGSSSYVLRTSAYRSFYSDYIEVEPGEEIYGEMYVKYISGSGGLFYYGVERFDKDKRPIAGNTGTTYFVAGGSNVTSTSWQKFSGHHTIPTSHTAYNGSDGGGVRYVRIRVLMNYNTGGALREFTAPVLMRTTVQGRIRTDQNVYAPIYYDSNDNNYYLDPNSVSHLNDVRGNIFYDRSNTTYYLDPASSGTSLRVRGEIQNPSVWINDGDNYNNYNENIRLFNAPNGVSVIGFSASGTSGTPTTSILGYSDRLEVRYGGGWQTRIYNNRVEFLNEIRATRYYDRNDTAYYGDFASTSVLSKLHVGSGSNFGDGTDPDISTSTIFATSKVVTPRVVFLNDGSGDDNYIEHSDNNGAYTVTGRQMGAWFSFVGDKITATAGNSAGIVASGLKTSYIEVAGEIQSPIYYDSNDTAYYGNFASTSITNYMRANRFEMGGPNEYISRASGNYGTIRVDGVSGSSGTWAGYAIRNDWVFMSDGATNAGIYNDTDNEWAILAQRNSDVQIFYNGTWEERSRSGYMEARGSYRAPIFYDSNNTTYRIDGNGTSRLLTLQVDNVIQGNINGYASYLLRDDNRIIAPNEDPAGRLQFGFTSWNNNNTAPYADYLHLRSYTDASGGSDNLVSFKKSGIGMRIWQQSWNSGTAYSTYRNVAVYNENPDGGGNDLYAAIYYDEDDTAYRVDPTGISHIRHLEVAANEAASEYWRAAIEVREYNYGGAQTDSWAYAPRIGFHWGGRVASQIGLASNGEIRILNNPGNATESFRAYNVNADSAFYGQIFYDSNNTGYYCDPSSSSNFNSYVRANEFYARNWFRNDNSGEGLYNEATAMHWYSTGSNNYRIYSTANTVEIQMTTSGNTMRGYVYANNSNDIGFLNNSGNWIFRTRQSYAELYGDLYANIMYDRNNSAYYSDPASTSRFNTVRANRFTNDGGVSSDDNFGIFWDSGLSQAYAIFRENGGWTNPYPDLRIAFHTGIKMGANAGYNGMRFYTDYDMSGQVMSINNASDPLGGGNVYVNNNLQAGSSLRAPIFYDSNDTTYRMDMNSTNGSRFRGVHYETMAYMALPGHTRDSGEYYRARPRITSDTNYWTGSMGWGRQDMTNTVADWGSGFIDSWSNPANQPSGTSHWVGVQSYHYSNGSSRYGWQMVGGPIENLRFRSTWGGFRTWRTIPVLNVNDGNDGAMYASIYYDANNSGFYCDPSDFSNFNTGLRATEIYARNWFRNDNNNEGMYNQNTGMHSYSRATTYWVLASNNGGHSVNLQFRSSHEGTLRAWIHGSTDGWQGFLNSAGAWKLRTRHTDGYSPSLQFREEGDESWTGNPGNNVGKIEYHADRFYIVSGGNSNRIVQFRRDGSDRSYIDNNGLYVGTATSARWADVAERYSADREYEPGQVLGINLDGDSEVTLYQPGMPLAGAVSTKPGVRMNDMGIENDKSKKSKMNPFIALKGRIPVHVNGDVKKGQWVVADRDGKGKGVDYGTPGINTFDIIGIALSDSKDGEVEVKV